MRSEETSGREDAMRRFAAGVVLAALLTLFVAIVTRTTERRVDRGTATVLVVTVECPCGGVCEAHAEAASDLETQYAEAESRVLKLPLEHVVGQRSYNQVRDVDSFGLGLGGHDNIIDREPRSRYVLDAVINHYRGTGRVLKLPRRSGRLNVNYSYGKINMYDASAASVRMGRFSVGVL